MSIKLLEERICICGNKLSCDKNTTYGSRFFAGWGKLTSTRKTITDYSNDNYLDLDLCPICYEKVLNFTKTMSNVSNTSIKITTEEKLVQMWLAYINDNPSSFKSEDGINYTTITTAGSDKNVDNK